MKLPTEFGVELEVVRCLLQFVKLLVNPVQTVFDVEVGFPREIILLIDETYFTESSAGAAS